MASFEMVIRPRKGWEAVDFREIYRYRELFGFLVWRDIKIRYRQTLLGGLWAGLQPVIAVFIFTVVFNRLGGVRSGPVPYPLFAFAGMAPWLFFSNSVTQSSNSLLTNQHMVSKIYFPRLFIPLASIAALLVDLSCSMVICLAMMLYYRWPITWNLFLVPVFAVMAFVSAGAVGLTLSALNVNFRDIKYIVPFLVQMGLFVTPVIYPPHYIPAKWQFLLGLNPMAGVVTGFRYCLLGTEPSWNIVGISAAVCTTAFIVGLLIFRRMERRFADVI